MRLHQVRPLQRYTQVQTPRLQSDPTDSRVPNLHAQRHGSILLMTPNQHFLYRKALIIRKIVYLCTMIGVEPSYCQCKSRKQFTCWNRSGALLSCAPESGKFKQHTRRSTTVHVPIRGLVVSCSVCKVISGTKVQECGIRKSTFF